MTKLVRTIVAVLAVACCACRAPEPPGATVPPAPTANAARGKTIYDAKCAECHGASGQGEGRAAPLLKPAPRDFTAGKYKLRTTETGSLPTDADLVASVTRGLAGTSMPAWEGLLSPTEIRDVVEYVKSLSPRFANEQPQEVLVAEQVANVPAATVRGAAVYEKLQCGKCHGSDGRSTDAVARDFVDDWGKPLSIANLTEPWTFRGGATAKDIYLRFRTGMSGTPMPSFKDAASDGELWDLAHFVTSLARKPVWEMTAEEVSAHYAREATAAQANPVARGESIVQTRLCPVCHSPLDTEGRILPGLKMAGGQIIRIGPYGDFATTNLTSDKETGIGAYTDGELKAAITRGDKRDGSRMLPFPMDWPAYSALSPGDLDAVVAYLRSIPPVRNLVPPPSRPMLPVYLWGKFRMLILGHDLPFLVLPGNAGVGRRTVMMRLAKRAAIVLLVVGVAALVAFLYFVPPFLSMAPEDFSGPQNDAAPGVNDIADPAERLIAERGRYLVVTSGCIGCHHVPTPQGPDFSRYLAGGLKFQDARGTYVSRNLTPDSTTGLGARSDAEVKRVLRSGVLPDGHVAGHRLMPWAGYTAWTEEDIHAVVVYLRHLRPVVHAIPDPAPPSPMTAPTAVEQVYGGRDYGMPQ